ncbi:hypothetical protein [Candidatus Harpocratesius sp.]
MKLNAEDLQLLLSSDVLEILSPSEISRISRLYPSIANFSSIQLKLRQKTKSIFKRISEFNSFLQDIWVLPTNILFLDRFFYLNNNSTKGIISKNILMLYGKARSGKSQICHQLPVELYKKFKKSSYNQEIQDKTTIFIDTEGTFRPGRIKEIAKAQDLDGNQILNKIISVKAQNYVTFNLMLKKIQEILELHSIKLLIIDSLTRVYRLEMAKDPSRTAFVISNLAQNLKQIQKWADNFNLIVCLTSQVTSRFEESYFFDITPVLATTLNRFVKNWILLGVNEEEIELSSIKGLRYAHIVNSEIHQETIEKFIITPQGVQNFYG